MEFMNGRAFCDYFRTYDWSIPIAYFTHLAKTMHGQKNFSTSRYKYSLQDPIFPILGMYFCKYDKGEMASMVYNWESDQVDAVVVTDGSRVLGLGDLGIGGLGISIGKLDLYVAAGGFHPRY